MTSDYLKQLQLTKQLEQKAKEATKNRKAAESKIAEAEKALALSKSLNAEVGEAEKNLAEGKAAYEKKDYTTALAMVQKILENLSKVESEKIIQMLGAAEGILALIVEEDQGKAEIEELVGLSKKLLGEGKYEESLKKAQESWERADKYTDQRISDMFAQAQSLITLAEANGLSVSAKRQLLAKAIKLQEDGDREGAISKLASCSKGLKDSFTKQMEDRTGVLEQMLAEISEAGAETAPIPELLTQSREAFAADDIQGALDLMTRAEQAIIPNLLKAVGMKLAQQDERRDWLLQEGADVSKYAAAAAKVTEMIQASEGEGSLEWLRRSAKALRECEADLVLSYVEDLRPRMVLAKKLGADLDGVMEKLEEVRTATTYGKVSEALELVDEASAELDDSLAPFRELGKELERTKAVFLQARKMRIVSKEAAELVARSRRTVLNGEAEEASGPLQEARAILVRSIQEGCLAPILDGELLISMGWSMGASVDDEATELDGIVADLKEGGIENITALLAKVNEALRGRISERTSEIVGRAISMTTAKAPVVDLSKSEAKAREASKVLESNDWYGAYTLAQEAIEEAERLQAEALKGLMTQANALLEIARTLGSESMTLNQKMAGVGARQGPAGEAVQVVTDVIQFAKGLIKDELTRSISQIMRSIAASRKNGVKSASAEGLAEESSRALMAGDLEKSYGLYHEASRELEKTVSLHSEVYDLIVTLSRLMGELNLGADTKVFQLLQETKKLFEDGRYDGARVSARNCYQEAEQIGAKVIAPRKVQEARELLPTIFQMGLNGGPLGLELEEAQADLVAGRAPQALAKAKEVHRRSSEMLSARIGQEIEETRRILKSGGISSDGSSAMSIVEKAESLVAEKRYSDAIRAVRFARNEATQLSNLRTTVDREIARIEEDIAEVMDLGIEVKESMEMVHQADKYRVSGRYNIAIEVARKGLHSARQAARDRIVVDMSKTERERGAEALKGFDLVTLQSSIKKLVMERLDQHRFVEARKALDIYLEGLSGLSDLRDQCASSLSKLAEGLVGVPRGSVLMQDTSEIMARAQQAYQDGRFKECLGLTEECRAAGSSALLAHEEARRRLEAARDLILEGEGRRHLRPETTELLSAAENAFDNGRYTEMDRALLGARRAHREAAERSNRAGLAELVNLLRLYHAAELASSDMPPEVLSLMDQRLSAAEGIRNLAEIIGATRARATEGTRQKLERTREKVERAARSNKYVEMSRAILPIAERSLSEGKLEQCLTLLRDAEMLIGASTPMVQELRAKGRRFNDLRKVASRMGVTEGAFMDHYRQALRSHNVGSAISHLGAATVALQRALDPFMPALEAAPDDAGQPRMFIGNRGAAPAVDIYVIGPGPEGSEEKKVAGILWPGSTVHLPDVPAEGHGVVQVRYRLLLSDHTFTDTIAMPG